METVSRTYLHWLRDDRDVPAAVLDGCSRRRRRARPAAALVRAAERWLVGNHNLARFAGGVTVSRCDG